MNERHIPVFNSFGSRKKNDSISFGSRKKTKSYIHISMFGSVNVSAGKKEERLMMTGMHTVADIFCVGCGAILGWKYVCDAQFAVSLPSQLPLLTLFFSFQEAAHEKSQKYKEGKFILER